MVPPTAPMANAPPPSERITRGLKDTISTGEAQTGVSVPWVARVVAGGSQRGSGQGGARTGGTWRRGKSWRVATVGSGRVQRAETATSDDGGRDGSELMWERSSRESVNNSICRLKSRADGLRAWDGAGRLHWTTVRGYGRGTASFHILLPLPARNGPSFELRR